MKSSNIDEGNPQGAVTVFTSVTPATLGKTYALQNGKLEKTTAGAMSQGKYRVITFASKQDFAALLTNIETNQALSHSLPGGGDQEGVIVTSKVAVERPRSGQLARTKENFKFREQPGVMILDYDPPDPQNALTREQLWEQLTKLSPAVAAAQCVWWCSGSSHIHGPDGEIQGLRGQRFYLLVMDASDIERAGKNLAARCWLGGQGYIKISTSGSCLKRTLFDEAMHEPARLDFIGGAVCTGELSQRRGQPVIMGGSAWLDTREAFPELDKHEAVSVKRLVDDAMDTAKPKADAARGAWLERKIDNEAPRLQAAKEITIEEARQQVRKKYETALNGVLTGEFEIQLPDGGTVTVDEVLRDKDRWALTKTLDPIHPEHRGGEDCGILYTLQKHPVLYTLAHGTQPFKLLPSRKNGQDDSGLAPHLSEISLSAEFAAAAVGIVRWSPGMGWMHNQGSHWERDLKLESLALAKSVCKGAAETVERPQLKVKTASCSTVKSVLHLARNEPGIVTDVKEWDAHQMILNTPGGAYDLATGERVTRDGWLFTQVAGIAPTKTPTPIWDKFLLEIFDGQRMIVEFVQRMGGYALTGRTSEQKLFYLYGSGANGKSVFLEVLRNIAGSYAHNLPSEALMTAKHERHPTTFAALNGKRLAVSSEIEDGAHWAESKIKSLTGDATMTAHFMRQDEFEFTITHKHILAGNFKPRLKGDDPAVVRRMVLIPFNQTFSGTRRDDRLPEKLRTEYPGILQWFIEGARKWSETGLQIPAVVIESSSEYMNEQNDIALWMDDSCDVGLMFEASGKHLYAAYSAWKVEQGEKPQSKKSWGERLLNANPAFKRVPRIEGARDRGFWGLRLRSMARATTTPGWTKP